MTRIAPGTGTASAVRKREVAPGREGPDLPCYLKEEAGNVCHDTIIFTGILQSKKNFFHSCFSGQGIGRCG